MFMFAYARRIAFILSIMHGYLRRERRIQSAFWRNARMHDLNGNVRKDNCFKAYLGIASNVLYLQELARFLIR